MSTYEAWAMSFSDALLNKFRHAMATINSGESGDGVQRFASGAGRHGQFERISLPLGAAFASNPKLRFPGLKLPLPNPISGRKGRTDNTRPTYYDDL